MPTESSATIVEIPLNGLHCGLEYLTNAEILLNNFIEFVMVHYHSFVGGRGVIH